VTRQPMTGQELLDLLRGLTPEQLRYTVVAEGCDCEDVAYGIDVLPYEILVSRRPNVSHTPPEKIEVPEKYKYDPDADPTPDDSGSIGKVRWQ
jgi:hypothetical protein